MSATLQLSHTVDRASSHIPALGWRWDLAFTDGFFIDINPHAGFVLWPCEGTRQEQESQVFSHS